MRSLPRWTVAPSALLAAAFWFGCSGPGRPEPPVELRPGALTPQQSMATMQLASGFRLALVASEPEVRQPVALNWDDRGRLWVVEYIQYPDPAGLKPLEWDRYFRTKYDRVPDPHVLVYVGVRSEGRRFSRRG